MSMSRVIISKGSVFERESGRLIGYLSRTGNGHWSSTKLTGEVAIFLLRRQAIAYLLPPKPCEYSLRMMACGPNKIQVIKAIRELTGLPLKESKAIADGMESGFYGFKCKTKDDAERAADRIREHGATVKVVES